VLVDAPSHQYVVSASIHNGACFSDVQVVHVLKLELVVKLVTSCVTRASSEAKVNFSLVELVVRLFNVDAQLNTVAIAAAAAVRAVWVAVPAVSLQMGAYAFANIALTQPDSPACCTSIPKQNRTAALAQPTAYHCYH
jgi:hypothetical protein